MRISDWSSDVCSSDLRERTRRVGGVLQRGCKGAAQSFEEIAVDLPFKGEDQVLLPLISGTKIDIDAVHRDRVLPVLGCVVAMKLHDEQAGATGIASPETEIGRAHVGTPVTNAHLVCRLLLEKKK